MKRREMIKTTALTAVSSLLANSGISQSLLQETGVLKNENMVLKTMPKRVTVLNTGEKAECMVERVSYEKEPFLFIRNLPVNKFSNEVLVSSQV